MPMKLIAIGAAVALLGAAACSSDNGKPNASTSGVEKPISLTGCLQKGDGNNDLLTQLSEPTTGGVATKAEGDGSKVEREQLNAAEHSYRLNAAKGVDDDEWDKLVGTKVRVHGTLTKRSEVGTSGTDSNDREKIHESDLARVDVDELQQIGDACGGSAKPMPPK
jgi:hypothetical protein